MNLNILYKNSSDNTLDSFLNSIDLVEIDQLIRLVNIDLTRYKMRSKLNPYEVKRNEALLKVSEIELILTKLQEEKSSRA